MGELTATTSSPLLNALLDDDVEQFRSLLDAGADPTSALEGGTTIVHVAAMVDDPTYLELLVEAGADVDVANASSGETPLMAAMRADREPQFRRLLDAGADPDRADADGDTPLHVAGLIKAADRALDLLAVGADPAARNDQGATFKTYLDIRPARLSDAAQRRFDAVDVWLAEHAPGLGVSPDD